MRSRVFSFPAAPGTNCHFFLTPGGKFGIFDILWQTTTLCFLQRKSFRINCTSSPSAGAPYSPASLRYIGIVMLKDDAEKPSLADVHDVGTVARIIKKINLPDGGVNAFVSTIHRFKIRKTLNAASPMVAAVEYLDDVEDNTFEIKALTRAIVSEMKEISENNPMFTEEMRLNMVNIDHPGKIADFVASILNIDKDEQQQVLETLNVRERMNQVLVYIKKEEEILRVQKKNPEGNQ